LTLLLEEAEKIAETNESLYNTLCRAAQVLLCAHLEGYVKDLVKNSLEDINHYSDFKSANKFLKRKTCEYFVLLDPEQRTGEKPHAKVTELNTLFENSGMKFKKEYFGSDENANPKASVLEKIAKQYGIKDFFTELKKSRLDLVFSNTNSENQILRDSIQSYVLSGTSHYPYTIELEFLEINPGKISSDNLWDAFLSNVLKRRHDIVHGNEMENSTGHTTIETDIVKVQILIYAFTVFICSKCKPNISDV
ncbi:MAG TPA: HEPN domain-containing protein, partial [Chitinophagales bacterium]|nr:HEPN domain-containing protein [Chitinophagales bacterium]